MDLKKMGKNSGRFFATTLFSLSASLAIGSVAFAASSPINLVVIPIVNKGLTAQAGNEMTYIYQLTNSTPTPVAVTSINDSNCSPVTYDAVGEDLVGDHLLRQGEVFSYYCKITLSSTLTNNVTVTGTQNGAPVTATGGVTVNVAPSTGVPGTSGTTGGQGGTGTNPTGAAGAQGTGGQGTSGSAVVPKGMPNTGFGGGANSKLQVSFHASTPVVTSEKLEIPAIGVKASVVALGLNSDGTMGAPQNAKVVGLYTLGAQPGNAGNAVIAGHLDTYTTSHGVFENLNKLASGADVYVVNGQNQQLHYKVDHTATYNDNSVPMNEVFGSTAQAHLNLITCSGDWDSRSHEYTKRLVVYTDLVQ